MKVTVDTNVLVRAATGDDIVQSFVAGNVLRESELLAITLPCLCELVWVLRAGYSFSNEQIWKSLSQLLSASNVAVNREVAEFGMAVLKDGGDFADGVIAYEGAWLGGEEFVSFDKKATRLVQKHGRTARLLK